MKIVLLLLFASMLPISLVAQSPQDATGKPFVIEYYYKTKWGHADEFLHLFKKNHYPLLMKQVEAGRMLKVWVDQPRYHTTEDGRWDYRVTIVFKNSAAANEPFDEEMMKKQLWPDQATYAREEQRRFEILDSHWDLPIKIVDVDAKIRFRTSSKAKPCASAASHLHKKPATIRVPSFGYRTPTNVSQTPLN